MTLRIIRATLTGFLLVAAALLSFGALRHAATQAQIIHGDLLMVSAHTLAGIWALCPDVLAAVGIVGLRIDNRDPRAWVALILGLGLTLLFQVWADPWPWLLRGVPAAAGAMAVWILEVPWASARGVVPPVVPQPVEVPASVAPLPGPEHPPTDQPRTTGRTNGASFTADQMRIIEAMVAEKRSAKDIQRELGVSDRQYREKILPLVQELRGQMVRSGGRS
jgi:hypothetical protein